MNWLKYDINKDNTIIELNGKKFDKLNSNELQVESNYDFPTSQPLIFYRWNESLNSVEVNKEENIKKINEETGTLGGLDLEPFIEDVHDAEFLPSTTKIITIVGLNFSPFSLVEISGESNFVNTIYFDSPKQLRVEVSVGMEEGYYNVIVKNSEITSKDSGLDKFLIKNKTVVDLRTTDIINLDLDLTTGIKYQQDSEKGLRFYANNSSWNRGVKFNNYSWNRNDNVTFEMIFTKTSDDLFMCGIGSSSLDVNNISSAYYKQEIGVYHNNNNISSLYGGGDVGNWNQSIGTVINTDKNIYYKIKFENSGSLNSNCGIYEVDVDDWDDEILLHKWVSTCIADDLILIPFVLPQSRQGNYYITGFRF